MFIVINDPPAADELVACLSRHGCHARKRTPFVVDVDASAGAANIERIFVEWHAARTQIRAELITGSHLEQVERA